MSHMSLTQTSPQYFSQNHTYEIFSQCEDKPGLVAEYLINQCAGKTVIDYGCGTGKYTQILAPYAQKIYAIDQSSDQITTTKQKTSAYQNISYQIGNDGKAKMDAIVDVIICCWVLGTVTDIDARIKIFDNLKNNLKPGGKIILVENGLDSEFEQIRGKNLITPNPTKLYNQRLVDQGCTLEQTFSSYFMFESHQQATYIFSEIWGSNVGKKVGSQKIKHQIVVFEHKKIAS